MLAGVAAAVDDDAVRCGRAAVEILIGMTRNTVSGGWDMAGGFNCDARKLGISLVCTWGLTERETILKIPHLRVF